MVSINRCDENKFNQILTHKKKKFKRTKTANKTKPFRSEALHSHRHKTYAEIQVLNNAKNKLHIIHFRVLSEITPGYRHPLLPLGTTLKVSAAGTTAKITTIVCPAVAECFVRTICVYERVFRRRFVRARNRPVCPAPRRRRVSDYFRFYCDKTYYTEFIRTPVLYSKILYYYFARPRIRDTRIVRRRFRNR